MALGLKGFPPVCLISESETGCARTSQEFQAALQNDKVIAKQFAEVPFLILIG